MFPRHDLREQTTNSLRKPLLHLFLSIRFNSLINNYLSITDRFPTIAPSAVPHLISSYRCMAEILNSCQRPPTPIYIVSSTLSGPPELGNRRFDNLQPHISSRSCFAFRMPQPPLKNGGWRKSEGDQHGTGNHVSHGHSVCYPIRLS